MKLRKTIALLALVAGALSVPSAVQAEGWFSDLDDAKDVTLGEVVRNPRDFVDVVVRMKVYFDRTASNYNPYYTRFSDNVYGNFAAWPINARLYEKRDFGRSYPFFFVQRMNKKWRGISSLGRVTPVEIVAVVREVFRGQPWIEMLGYSTISEGLRSDDVKNIVRGDAYMRVGKYDKAVNSYSKVDADDVPKSIRADVYRKRGDAKFYAGDYKSSARDYREGLELAPKSKVLEQGLAAAQDMAERKKKPEVGRERAHLVAAPAASHVPVSGDRNDVDDIIDAFEDAATVKAQVERDRLDAEKRAARVRDGSDVATVSGNEDEVEPKEAAAAGEDEVDGENDVVVKDGVVEGEDGCGTETPEESDEPVKPEDGEKVEKGTVEEETDEVDGETVEEVEGENEEGCGEEVTEETDEPTDVEEPMDVEETEDVEEPKDVEETEDVEEPKDVEETEDVEEPKDVEETEDVEEPKDVEETEDVDEPMDAEETEDVDEPMDAEEAEGCAEKDVEEAKDEANDVEEGCSEEVDENQEAEEVVEEEAEEVVEELVKDNEVREGEVLVKDGEPVVDNVVAEESDEVVEEEAEGYAEEAVEEAADETTEGCGEEVATEEETVADEKKEPQVTFSFADEDVRKVIGVIETFSGANIVVAPEVKGNVTVNIKNVSWRDALEQIVKTLGYVVVQDGEVLRVQPETKVVEEPAEETAEEEPAEEGSEESTEDEQPAGDGEEGCAEESTEEEQPGDEGCAEESTEDAEETEEVAEETKDIVVKDGEVVEEGEEPTEVQPVEEGCSEEVDESQEAEEVVEETEDVVVKDGEVEEEAVDEVEAEDVEDVVVEDGEADVAEPVKEPVPVRKTVEKLPRLPFFGCEDVSDVQLRAIIEEVLNNPEF